jgi:hypothetical protein
MIVAAVETGVSIGVDFARGHPDEPDRLGLNYSIAALSEQRQDWQA